MKIFIFILNIIVVLGFTLWLIFEPGWESALASFTAAVAFISQFFWNDKVNPIFRREKATEIGKMLQKSGNSSTQYQSTGNITINNNGSTGENNTAVNDRITYIDEMAQEGGDNSTQYQSSGDISINNR